MDLERALKAFPDVEEDKPPVSSTWDPKLPLDEGSCPPRAWYTEQEIFELEKKSVFANRWQAVGESVQGLEGLTFVLEGSRIIESQAVSCKLIIALISYVDVL